jgi:hypothetical protein
MKAFDVPTPEELIQKPLSNRDYHEKGISNQGKDKLEMNQHGSYHVYTKAMLGIFLYSYPQLN